MGADIDQLNIKIEADAQKAHSSVDTLINKLGRLNAALGGIDASNITSLSNGFNNFASSVRSFNSLDTKKIGDVSKGFKKFEKINAGNIGKLSDSLKPLSEGIGALNSVSFDNKSLQNLINSITRLSNSNVGNLSNVDFTSLGNSIKSLASSLSGAENVQRSTISMTNAVANLAKSGSNIASVSSELPRLSNALSNFIRSMSKVNTVVPETIAFTQAIGSLANAGAKTATTASHLGILSQELKKFMETMSTAPVVNRNIIDMTNSLAKLANAGASSGRAANSLAKAFDGFSRSSHIATKKSFSLASAIGKVYATYWLLFRAMGKIRDAIDISSQLTEVQNVVDVTFGNMAYKVEDFAKTSIEQFGMSELSLKQYASRFQAMGSAMGISGSSIGSANSFLNKQTNGYVGLSDSMSDVSLNLTKLTADMASFYNVEQAVVAEDLEAIFTGQTRPLRQYGLDLTQATLQEWALKNGIDADVKSMSQAEKTMLRYQYVMANTGAAQGDFARTANTWANQVRILKQNFEQFGSVVGGTLINAFKPLVQALNSVMGNLIAFAETVSNALGKIFGWKYESASGGAGTTGLATDMEDAADSAGGLADNTGQAAKNIDKMKAGLRAFDELKTITLPDSNSGSGGGSGSGGSSGGASGASGSGGQWVKQDSIFDDYKSSIDSLYGLGEYIGNTLKGEMDSINWDSVYEGARSFGSGLASFLNGLFAGEKGETLFGSVGTTVAGALNTVINASLGFTDTFDFEQFGLNLADSVNQFFTTFDFAGLADAINGWVDGFWETVTIFFGNLDYKAIFGGLRDFIEGLEPDTIATIIGVASIKKFGRNIGTAIKDRIGSIAITAGLVIGITEVSFSLARSLSKSFFEWYNEKYGTNYDTSKVDELSNWDIVVSGFRLSFNANGKFQILGLENLKKLFPENEVVNTIYGLLNGAVLKAFQNLSWNDFWNVFLRGITTDKVSNLWSELKKKWDRLPNKITDFKVKISTSVSELWAKFKKSWGTKNLFASLGISTKAKTLFDNFKARWGKRNVNIGLSLASGALSGLWTSITTFFSGKSIGIGASTSKKADGGVFSNGSWKPIQRYAAGGIPDYGQLFWAREAGPELVGTLGGSTAVMNNDQIVASVSAGVYQAVKAAMGNGQSVNVTFRVEGDPKGIFKVTREQANEFFNRTGEPAFPI